MTDTAAQATEPSEAAAPKPAKKKPATYLVLDTTARPDIARTHELIIDGIPRPFTFHYGKPLELEVAIAVKFLKHEGFKRVDADGNVIPFKRAPKQPDELQAGETLHIAVDETIARFDELTNNALQHRCLEMPGGEQFARNPLRQAMIDFIVDRKRTTAKANTAKPERLDLEEFTPEPELDDELAA